MSKTLADLERGERVCVIGRGTDVMVHRHMTVLRVTKTLLVVANSTGVESGRFRLTDSGSMPYSPYGGTSVHVTCQRPKQVQR